MTVSISPNRPQQSGFLPGLPGRPNLPAPFRPGALSQDTFQKQSPNAAASALAMAGAFRTRGLFHSSSPSPVYMPPLAPTVNVPGVIPFTAVINNDPHEKMNIVPALVSGFRSVSQEAEAAGRDVLRLNAGDNNVGREPEEWELHTRLLNLIGYHAVTMGNHELDLGTAGYAQGLKTANFPTVVSNLKIPAGNSLVKSVQEGRLLTQPHIVRSKQGVYGIIGATTPELKKVVSSRAKLEGLEVQSFDETVATVQAQAQWLQSQGINKVILLSHLGYDLDQKLAQRVSGIDIIVGGHSHDIINGITPGANYLHAPDGKPVLIVQAGKNAQLMGRVDVLFTPDGHIIPQRNALLNLATQAPDPQAAAIRDKVLGKPHTLAQIANPYDANGNEFHADPVAQFTADAIRSVTGADIGFVRSPEIRSNFEAGAFTNHDLKALMPFMDPIVRTNVTGSEILSALNRSAQGLAKHESHPGMLHPSGMAVTLNQKSGQVEQAYVLNKATRQWEWLQPNKIYRVGLGEFSILNKEFPEFAHPERVEYNSGKPLQEFFAWGLRKAGGLQKPVIFQDDGRLQIK